MSNSQPSTSNRAAVRAWCEGRESELTCAIRTVYGPFAQIPLPQDGEICRQALDFAVSLRAAELVTELGPMTMGGHASLGEALRQVQLLTNWLEAHPPEEQDKGDLRHTSSGTS